MQRELAGVVPPLTPTSGGTSARKRILVVCAVWVKYHSVYRNFNAYVEALKKDFDVSRAHTILRKNAHAAGCRK